MLVKSDEIINKAKQGGYAVGSFNTADMEITQAIVRAAERLNAPVIVATTEKSIQFAGIDTLSSLIQLEAAHVDIPVALHLDHGKSVGMIRQALAYGYTSVMVDGSDFEYPENVEITLEAAKFAHQYKIPIEGELGRLGRVGESTQEQTDPDSVEEFIRKTGVDFLAISIGPTHGLSDKEHINFELLEQIRQKTDIPLVLHGGSGVPNNEIQQAIKLGICKINIDTDIRYAYSEAIRSIIQSYPYQFDPREVLTQVNKHIEKVVEKKIRLFGSENKA